MSAPDISILMPTYNYGEFIAQAITSVLSQTFERFELVVSDNASSDATEAVVRGFAANDTRVRYFRNETNLGLSANYNLCHERACPESRYLIGLPADDWWDPKLLESLIKVAQNHSDVALIHCDAYRVEANGTVINRFTELGQELPEAGVHQAVGKLFQSNYIPFQGCLVDREALRRLWPVKTIYDPDVPHANDWYLWLQLLCRGAKAYYLAEPLAYFRKHERANTMIDKIIPRLKQEVLVYEKTAQVCPVGMRTLHRREHTHRLKRLGFLLLQTSQFAEARAALGAARKITPQYQRDLALAQAIARFPLPGRVRVELWNTVVKLAARREQTV